MLLACMPRGAKCKAAATSTSKNAHLEKPWQNLQRKRINILQSENNQMSYTHNVAELVVAGR
jgi:hypothetical protein